MDIIIGVEGGGSRSRAALLDVNSLEVIAYQEGGPSNYHNIGLTNTVNNIVNLIDSLVHKADNRNIKLVSIGLPALNTRFDKERLYRAFDLALRDTEVLIEHDVHIALYASTGGKPGILVVAGTGSNVYGYRMGERFYAGDWGWLIGDEGSSFWIGRRILNLSAREYDGRSDKVGILAEILSSLGFDDYENLMDWIYGRDRFVERVAHLAKIACEIIDAYPAVYDIFREGAEELSGAVHAVYKRMLCNKIDIFYIGGLFECRTYRELFISNVAAKVGIKPRAAERLPLTGALALGLSRLGRPVNMELMDKVDKGIHRLIDT